MTQANDPIYRTNTAISTQTTDIQIANVAANIVVSATAQKPSLAQPSGGFS
jgi:hypothetical protein